MTAMFLAGFCLGIAALWIFLELIALTAMRRTLAPTPHRRQYRDLREREPDLADVGFEAAYPRDVHDGSEHD